MLNQIVMVGKLTKKEMVEGTLKAEISVTRSYKNEAGEYEADIFPMVAYNHVAEQTAEYCQVGDIIGIKGRIENNGSIYLVADKITFLSSK